MGYILSQSEKQWTDNRLLLFFGFFSSLFQLLYRTNIPKCTSMYNSFTDFESLLNSLRFLISVFHRIYSQEQCCGFVCLFSREEKHWLHVLTCAACFSAHVYIFKHVFLSCCDVIKNQISINKCYTWLTQSFWGKVFMKKDHSHCYTVPIWTKINLFINF